MLDEAFFEQLRGWGEQRGIVWESGLSDVEINQAEAKWDIRFPPDLRQLLLHLTSCSKGFIHWTKTPDENIRRRFEWPRHGFHFDIERNNLWLPQWGEPPNALQERCALFDQYFAKVPKLIPIYSHRYIPQEPHEECNPVFSIYQSDIIYYGGDLRDYMANEFSRDWQPPTPDPRHIPFWSDWADGEFD